MCRICRQEMKIKPVYPPAEVFGLTVLVLILALIMHVLYTWFWVRMMLLIGVCVVLILKRKMIVKFSWDDDH
jgi:hypothetical protein